MIAYRPKKSLLTSGAEVLVNPVNTLGVSGAGLALAFKTAYPTNYDYYRAYCRKGRLKPGQIFAFRADEDTVILNVATKGHWRDPSDMATIEVAINAIVFYVAVHKPYSIAIPALGCGLGGLDPALVIPKIEEAFFDMDFPGLVLLCVLEDDNE